MTPHKQRFAHRPNEGIYGDCARTVIACLLDIDPEQIPHVHREQEPGEQQRELNAFLSTRGLRLVEFAFDSPPADVMEMMAVANPGARYILGAASDRGTDHVVICKDREFEHDPHPSNAFLDRRGSDGYVWVQILARLS